MTFNDIMRFFLRYDVREVRWFCVKSCYGFVVLFGNYPFGVEPPRSRLWKFSTALRLQSSINSQIALSYRAGLYVDSVCFVNFHDDSVEPPF